MDGLGSVDKVTIVRTQALHDTSREWVFVDWHSRERNLAFGKKCSGLLSGGVFMTADNNRELTGGPVVYAGFSGNEPFMHRGKAARDIVIGTFLCLGSCAMVRLFGDDLNPSAPPSGFFVYVGDRYMAGAPGCLITSACLVGILFVVKGVVELFIPPYQGGIIEKRDEEDANLKVPDIDEIVAEAGLKVKDRKEYIISDGNAVEIERKVIRYLGRI
jgi:hypothetical protein